MLTSDQAPVAFRADATELIERGTDTTLRLRPARGGAAITPDAATLTLTDPSGTVVVDAEVAVCTADSGQAAYVVPGSVTSALALGERWTVTWSTTLPGESFSRAVRLEAALVRARLYPVVSDQDLFRRVSSLDPSKDAVITTIEDYSPYLDDAWSLVQRYLLAKGDRPWLVLSPEALREVHLLKTLQLVFEDLSTRLNAAYASQAADYRAQYAAAWVDVKFVYDRGDQGLAGRSASGRKGAGGSVWLGGRMP